MIIIKQEDLNDAPKAVVIQMSEARQRFDANRCRHMHVEVDEQLEQVTCQDCKERLNAIAILIRYAKEESRLTRHIFENKALLSKIDQRTRCKCMHCGEMTRIRT